MKYISIAVEYIDPVKMLKASLVDSGARNISLLPTNDGWFTVRYEIKMPNPKNEIIQLAEKTGAKLFHWAVSPNGADFDFRIDDQLDEKALRQQIVEQIRSAGYRVS